MSKEQAGAKTALTEQEMLNQPKEVVIDRQFKNNCDYGFKQPNVNMFIRMAFESGFENGLNYQKYSQTTPEYIQTAAIEEERDRLIKKYQERIWVIKSLGKDHRFNVEIATLETVIEDLTALNK